MSLWKWSQTAASNATADSTINFREGQAPRTINDSIRALMAATAKFRDDISGKIETGGTSTALTLASYQTFTSLQDGIFVSFRMHATNGATPTLNVDSLGAKPLRLVSGEALTAGILLEGTIYGATYVAATEEWLAQGYVSPDTWAVPIGSIIPYTSPDPPGSNFAMCYGQAVSRTGYPILYGRCGVLYGTGDGSTTFNLPDCRGRVIAGLDNMGGTSANRLTGVDGSLNGDTIGATGGSETHTLTAGQLPANIPNSASSSSSTTGDVSVPGGNFIRTGGGGGTASGTGSANWTQTAAAQLNATTTTTTTVTINASGGAAHPNVQPTIILPHIIRLA